MIYPFIKVEFPNLGGYNQVRDGICYRYVYVGERIRRASDGKSVHPKSRMIGIVETDENGKLMLIPNTAYYEIMHLTPPVVAVAEGPGRKPKVRGTTPKVKPEFSEMSCGYGVVSKLLFEELGVSACLEEVFGEDVSAELETLAAYLCDGPHSSLSGLNDFVNENLCIGVSSSFDRRRAGEMLVRLSSQERGKFFSLWNTLHASETKHVFYDVTSFSTNSNQILRASYGYNRDGEDLPQINEGLFCSRETGLPLYMLSYEGSLNDAQNFKYAISMAKEHKVCLKRRGTTIVIDGGFSQENFNWAHMEGYNLIAGVSALRYKNVREAYLSWARTLTTDMLPSAWMVNDQVYVSSRVPITLGGVEGELVMYRDMQSQTDKERALIIDKAKKETELKECSHWLGKDFDSWAKSFEPYFKVERARNRKGFTYTEDKEAQVKRFGLCGKVTLFTTCKNMTDKEIMEAYRAKESVEDCFDTTKNGLCDKRLHVHGDRQIDGKMFALFVGLILRRTLHRRSLKWQEEYDRTDCDVIRELKKIRMIKCGEYWGRKDNLTKRQKDLIEELQLHNTLQPKQSSSSMTPHEKKRPKSNKNAG